MYVGDVHNVLVLHQELFTYNGTTTRAGTAGFDAASIDTTATIFVRAHGPSHLYYRLRFDASRALTQEVVVRL